MQGHRQTEHPRAFYPEYSGHAPLPARTPGWDTRIERQLDDGRSLARGLAWALMLAAAGVLTLGIMRTRGIGQFPAHGIDRRYIQ